MRVLKTEAGNQGVGRAIPLPQFLGENLLLAWSRVLVALATLANPWAAVASL